MAYSSGGVIQAIDYNYLAWGGNTTGTYNSSITNTAQVMGVGYGFRGYGQTITAINAVTGAGGDTITAAQWAGLVYLVNRGLGHQSGAAAQLASGSNIGITAGATISAFANVSTAVGTINTNANIYTTQGATTTGATFWANISGTNTTFENIFTRTLTWSSGDAARYFFNCGGKVSWVINNVINNNSTLRSADLVTQWGTYQGGGTIFNTSSTPRTGAGGTVNTGSTTLGYWALTTATQTVSQITSANYRYEYNSDYTNVRVRTSTQNSSGNGDKGAVIYLDFGSYMFSTYSGLNDAVDVRINHRIDYTVPESTYLNVSWGTPTIT